MIIRVLKFDNRRITRHMASYVPPKDPTWSMSDLKLTIKKENNDDPLVDSSEFSSCSSSSSVPRNLTLDHLCRLACIDISYSKVNRSDILKDINGILRCAQTLQNYNLKDIDIDDNINKNGEVLILTENNLRDDCYDDSNSFKRNTLFQNAKRVHDNKYFTAPKDKR